MAINIYNLRDTKPRYLWEFRVDRGTPLGNPYFLAREADRSKVCRAYELEFPIIVQGAQTYIKRMLAAYQEYGQLGLFCWCAPKQCHAETIRKYLNERIGFSS